MTEESKKFGLESKDLIKPVIFTTGFMSLLIGAHYLDVRNYSNRLENDITEVGNSFTAKFYQRLKINDLLKTLKEKVEATTYSYTHIKLENRYYSDEELLKLSEQHYGYSAGGDKHSKLELDNPEIEIFGKKIPYRDAQSIIAEIEKNPNQWQLMLDRVQQKQTYQTASVTPSH